MHVKSVELTCPTCGGRAISRIGALPDRRWFVGIKLESVIPGGSLYSCNACSFKFRFPISPPEKYEELYNNNVTTNWQFDSRRVDWALIELFLRNKFVSGCRILDFGCNTGELLSRFGPEFYKFGLDINSAAAVEARRVTGGVVWHSMQEIPEGSRFDAIVLSDVVEHVHNPAEILADLSNYLVDDGLILITTGDAGNSLWERFGANWWYCALPEHISFVSMDWLKWFEDCSDYKIEHSQTFRYIEFPLFRRILDACLVTFFGLAPRAYVFLGEKVRGWLGRTGDMTVRGFGLSDDHLFVVLKNARLPQDT